jgi:hypothetical protein
VHKACHAALHGALVVYTRPLDSPCPSQCPRVLLHSDHPHAHTHTPTDTVPPTGPEAEAAWVCETCIGEEQVGGTDLCAVCPRRGGLMLPSNDHRNVRWSHAFCAAKNAPTVFKSGRSPVLPEMAAVDVRGVTRDLKKFKCGICGRTGVRACVQACGMDVCYSICVYGHALLKRPLFPTLTRPPTGHDPRPFCIHTYNERPTGPGPALPLQGLQGAVPRALRQALRLVLRLGGQAGGGARRALPGPHTRRHLPVRCPCICVFVCVGIVAWWRTGPGYDYTAMGSGLTPSDFRLSTTMTRAPVGASTASTST